MALSALIVSGLVVLLGASDRRLPPPRRGPVYWWVLSAFGLYIVYLAAGIRLVDPTSAVIGNIALTPMMLLGVVMSYRSARCGGSVNLALLLALAPLVVTSAYILAGYSFLSPIQAVVFLGAALVVPRGGHDAEEIEAGFRDSLRIGVAALLVLGVVGPGVLGACRVDKCSVWGSQIGDAGGANVLGMTLAFVGIVAMVRLRWWRAVPVLAALVVLVDLCSSRSAFLPLGIGAVVVFGERVLRTSPWALRIWRGTCLTGVVTAIVWFAVLPVLPDDYTERGSLWLHARELIGERPLFGYGVSYWVRTPQTADFFPNYSAHNLLLELLVAGGVLGALAVSGGVLLSRVAVPASSVPLWWIFVISWLAGGVSEVLSAPGRLYLLPCVFALPFLLVSGRAGRADGTLTPRASEASSGPRGPQRQLVVVSVVPQPREPARVPHPVGAAGAGSAPPTASRRQGVLPVPEVRSVPERTTGVLEVDPTGHRLHYVRYLCDAAGSSRSLVLIPTTAAHSQEYAAQFGGLDVAAAPVAESAGRALLDAVDQAAARGVERLVITEADRHLVTLFRLLLRRPRLAMEFRLLLMRTSTLGGPEPVTPAMIVKPLLVRLLRLFPQVRIFFLTDALGVVRARRGFGGVRPVRDPVEVRTGAAPPRPPWLPAVEPGRIVLGLFGVISPRKNLPLLVSATLQEPRAVLVVAGRLWTETADYLSTDADAAVLREQQRLVVVDRLLDAEEFDAALTAVDVAAVLHDNDAPSGILAEACVRGTPVLVPRGAWLERVVDATGIGQASELTASAVAEALTALVAQREAHVRATRLYRARIGTADFTSTLLETS